MKSKLFALALLAGGSLFAQTRFSVGAEFGTPGYYPQQVRVGVAERPPYPGPGYEWVDGYYASGGGWVAGYWAPPSRYYVAPRYYQPAPGYYGGSYYRGRDWDHDRDRGRGREWREHEEHEHDSGWRR